MAVQRLQKFLAAAGVDSRRHCEAFILAGRVAINGLIVTQLGVKVDPTRDRVTLDGRPVELPGESVYLLLHKPAGYITTASDERGRPTVLDLLPPRAQRVFPVGRLDLESTGVLLLTNDGELAHRLTHPRYGIEREYGILLAQEPSQEGLARLRQGAVVEGRHTAPVRVTSDTLRTRDAPNPAFWLRIVLREGRKREVRELCLAAGFQVLQLTRVRYGPIHLGRLPPGAARLLTSREIAALRRAVGNQQSILAGGASSASRRAHPPPPALRR